MNDYGLDEDRIVNRYLFLQRSDYLSKADKERLEQFMDAYHQSKLNFIQQLSIMNEIETTKRIKVLEEKVA